MKKIKKGDSGLEVTILQHLLKHHKQNVDTSGRFDEPTDQAVRAFQRANLNSEGQPLEPDGIVGKETWRSLIESETGPIPVTTLPPEDPITLQRIKTAHPRLNPELEDIYQEIRSRGVNVRFTHVLRTFDEQEKLYAMGRTAPGSIVTNARGGQSYHNYGLAVDIVLLTGPGKVSWDRTLDIDKDNVSDWDEIVFVFKHYGWEWGGDWSRLKDYPHFQKTFGYSTAALLAMVKAGNADARGYVTI